MGRKQFTTTIDVDIQSEFKKRCLINRDKMNDVLEAFMNSYISGEFEIEKTVSFKIRKKTKRDT